MSTGRASISIPHFSDATATIVVPLDILAASTAYDHLLGDETVVENVIGQLAREDRLEYALGSAFGMQKSGAFVGFAALQSLSDRRQQAPLHLRSLTRLAELAGIPRPTLNARLRSLRGNLAELSETDLYLARIAVSPHARREGIGMLLAAEVVRRFMEHAAQRLILDVAATNATALAFYQKLGFRPMLRRNSGGTEAPEFISLLLDKENMPNASVEVRRR